jgi:hypothetical protein
MNDMKQNVWIKGNPKPQKLDNLKKMIKEVESFIENSQKLSKSINRLELRAGRVYFFQLVEQFGWNDPNNQFIIPLIDGRYAEFKYARITIYPNECTLDWQRHNNQWMTIFSGTFTECLQYMDEKDEWFQ